MKFTEHQFSAARLTRRRYEDECDHDDPDGRDGVDIYTDCIDHLMTTLGLEEDDAEDLWAEVS